MKTRLLGAAVLVALLVLFVPMFFPSSPPTTAGDQSVSLAIPPAPDRDLQTRTMSLNPDAAAPASAGSAGGVVIPAAGAAGGDRLATVDIASRRPTDVGDDAAAPGHSAATTEAPAAAPPPSVPAANEPVIKPQPAKPAPTTPAKPEPPSAEPVTSAGTAAHGNFSLNLSAYASSSGAQSLMRRVRALGYPVSSRTLHQGGKTLTAVEAGPFESRTAAEAARLKISQSIKGVPVRLESGASNVSSDDSPAAAKPSAKTASRAGGWAVQVAAMAAQSDANALRDKLRANGFDGFVDSVSVGGKKLWRVRAGPQTQRDDALRVRDQIKSKLGLAGNVVSVP